jgi:hypothetical protein
MLQENDDLSRLYVYIDLQSYYLDQAFLSILPIVRFVFCHINHICYELKRIFLNDVVSVSV